MVQIYKCPSCGANMVFDAETQQLSCSFCGRKMSVEEFDNTKEGTQKSNHAEPFKLFHCPSCGAELLTDEFTTATFCNYCGNSALIESRLEGEEAPDLIIPFQITKEQARESYKKWAKKGLLTPSAFSSISTIEKVSGLYVPFWLFDYDVNAQMEADCTRTRVERRKKQELVHTDHFMVERSVHARYDKVPADASEKMDDTLMDKLEPYEYNGLQPFRMEYMTGFLAEKYNYTSNQLQKRMEERIRDYGMKTVMESIQGYESVHPINQNIDARLLHTYYAMLPVWMLNYRYKGKDYMFTMNGQTGKIIGEAPISRLKLVIGFLLITAGISALCLLVAWFFF